MCYDNLLCGDNAWSFPVSFPVVIMLGVSSCDCAIFIFEINKVVPITQNQEKYFE